MVYSDCRDSVRETTKSSSEDGAGSAASGAATGAAARAITAKAAGAATTGTATAATGTAATGTAATTTGGGTEDSGKARVQHKPNETAAQSRASRPVDASRESCGADLAV